MKFKNKKQNWIARSRTATRNRITG